jgi:formylglycine-generating enzyme required for sulfatase activity
LEHGIVKILKDVTKEERANCKEAIAQRLSTEEGLQIELYRQAINILCEVLFGCVPSLPQSSPPPPQSLSLPQITISRQKFEGGSFTDPIAGDMVAVEGGTFMMGATKEQLNECYDGEKPAHYVTHSNYYIGKYLVTQRLWKRVMVGMPLADPSKIKGDSLPIESVSWNDIVNEFIPRLNATTGKTYRLPTEAEWEYAARGGVKSRGYKYAGSNNIDDVAWCRDNSSAKTHPVGTKKANELGIYDMSGNVCEWVNDWYGGYNSETQTNPKGPPFGSNRVLRGGSWYNFARYCRVSFRFSFNPDYRYGYLGFRLAVSP